MIEVAKIKEKNETENALYARGIDALDIIAKYLEDHDGYAFSRSELTKTMNKNFGIDKKMIQRALNYPYSFSERGIIKDADSENNFDKDLFYFDKELKAKTAKRIEVEKLRDSILENPEYIMKIKKFLDQIKLE